MNEKLNKNSKVEQMTKMLLDHEKENYLIFKNPLLFKTHFTSDRQETPSKTEKLKIVLFTKCFSKSEEILLILTL